MKQADKLMKQAVKEGIFPGGILLVSRDGSPLFFEAYGLANIFTGQPVRVNTFFDLASLTKPLATTLAVMKLVEMHKLDLSQSVGSVLAGFKGTEKEGMTVTQLLDHTSGLPDYQPYYLTLKELPVPERKTALRHLLLAEPLMNPIGREVVYSDLGFMILAWIIEQISGIQLDQYVLNEIYYPSGLTELIFPGFEVSGADIKASEIEFAATELCPWRDVLLSGVVHDDNAFAVGGVDGHAGLFGTAGDVNLLLSKLLLAYHGALPDYMIHQKTLRTFFVPRGDTGRALGFDMPSPVDSSSGKYFSKESVGHLGFTGTSFWMDLQRRIIVVLLTNRVHPSRDNERIRAFRPALHDAVMKNI